MLEIEIVESNIIEGGVEVFARAWRDGVQIGFGSDGTVDIERFRLINPPVLVDDPAGTIEINQGFIDEVTGLDLNQTRNLKEDPEEATLQALEGIINTVGKFDSQNIIPNKRGNTTTTVYANGGDGDTQRETEDTFANVRAAATGDSASSTQMFTRIFQRSTSEYRFGRSYMAFDTTSIGSGSTISSAVVNVTPSSLTNVSGNTADGTVLVWGNQGSNTTLTTSDYQPLNFTAISNTITYPNQSVNTELTFTLNDYSNIELTGSTYTKIGLLTSNDQANSISWGTDQSYMYYTYYATEETGTTKDPKIVVEHSGSGGTTRNAIFAFGGF